MPFRKNVQAHLMFGSSSQRELQHGLRLWTEVRGLALVTGITGVGKSITIRRFASELDDARFKVHRFHQVPTTLSGFLRSLSRLLGLPMRRHTADLFDQARDHLHGYADSNGPHPLLILDDVEGMRPDALDAIRRLTNWELDAEDRFSALLVGTDALLRTLRGPQLESLRSRFTYVCQLRPFSFEDTRNYIRFHLENADAPGDLISDDATRAIFGASRGTPRLVNQLALQGLIQAAVKGRDTLDGAFMTELTAHHPLYPRSDR
jgi:type II secretory pathway predicted ATPase ExeA